MDLVEAVGDGHRFGVFLVIAKLLLNVRATEQPVSHFFTDDQPAAVSERILLPIPPEPAHLSVKQKSKAIQLSPQVRPVGFLPCHCRSAFDCLLHWRFTSVER